MFSIRRHLSRKISWIGALAIAIPLGIFYLTVKEQLSEAFNENLLTKALTVSSLTDQENGKVLFDFSEAFLNYFDNDTPTTVFQIWNAQGETLFALRKHKDTLLPQPTSGTPDIPEYDNIHLSDRIHARVVSFSYTPRPENDHTNWDPNLLLRVSVAMDRTDLDEFLKTLFLVALGCWVIFTVAVMFLVRYAIGHGLRPLDELGTQLTKLGASTLSKRISVTEERLELNPIVRRLNELLARLQKSFERERRFNSAVAHELRTPLAELHSMTECAIKWPETRDASFDREMLEIVLRMESKMSRMFALSHAEKIKLRIVPVDLPQAVKNIWARFAGNAAKRKLICHLELDAKIELADPVFVDSILENLTNNITEHSPENSTLAIKGKSLDDTYVITFANAAPGLTQDDITNLFDSFWQKNPARSDNHHCGLGLSLSKAFANAMGWSLTASLKNGNLTLELRTTTTSHA